MARAHLTILAIAMAAITACSSSGGDESVARAATVTSGVATTADSTSPAIEASTSTSTTTSPTTSTTTTTSTTSTSTTTTTTSSTSTTTTTLPGPPMTACESVAHIGDSTSVYLWEAQYIGGNPAHAMEARYREVGVERVIADSSGGRSVVERIADWQTNALEAATSIRRSGFDGCWVIMIGTNDAANIAAGARTDHEDRILRLLYAIGGQPVLWVDTVSMRATTAYRNDSMRAWNDVLYRIADERENVEVLRWSEAVRPEWFQTDGLHYTAEGRVWRAAITALALAEAFPR